MLQPAWRQSLGQGARVWGTVAEVGARGLVVGLPNGLRGHVAPAEVLNLDLNLDLNLHGHAAPAVRGQACAPVLPCAFALPQNVQCLAAYT